MKHCYKQNKRWNKKFSIIKKKLIKINSLENNAP